ncbi:MAG TPA: hypothetical protein VFA10_11490 [Ktedonobacteraceae bacterium]|nr:hypothetical protein [Ktedonobacteraceae bacterium]
MQTDRQQYLTSLYGPCFQGDYEVSSIIKFRDSVSGSEHIAAIEWIAAPTTTPRHSFPARYIMESLDRDTGQQYEVTANNILGLIEHPEPALQKCPHCFAWHQSGTIDQCPFR